MFFLKPDDQFQIEGNIDQYGDSYARDVSAGELEEARQAIPILQPALLLTNPVRFFSIFPPSSRPVLSPIDFSIKLIITDLTLVYFLVSCSIA